MAKKEILVVDDEEDILELVTFNLTREGYVVWCASSGEEALESIKKQIPHLIILDLMLPGIDGLEVARRLKKNQSMENIPIIMLTAKGEEADIVTGLELGADDYITKPFSPRVLTARVRTVLRRGSVEKRSHLIYSHREMKKDDKLWHQSGWMPILCRKAKNSRYLTIELDGQEHI